MTKLNPELEEMRELFGEEGLKEILKAYEQSLAEFVVFLNDLNADAVEVKRQAHKMKSPSRSIGEIEIANFCEELEKAGVLTSEVRAQGLALAKRCPTPFCLA